MKSQWQCIKVLLLFSSTLQCDAHLLRGGERVVMAPFVVLDCVCLLIAVIQCMRIWQRFTGVARAVRLCSPFSRRLIGPWWHFLLNCCWANVVFFFCFYLYFHILVFAPVYILKSVSLILYFSLSYSCYSYYVISKAIPVTGLGGL
jgi:hypothetical protein